MVQMASASLFLLVFTVRSVVCIPRFFRISHQGPMDGLLRCLPTVNTVGDFGAT